MRAAHADVRIQFHDLYDELIADDARNSLICDDVIQAVRGGRSPVVLTERTEHLDRLAPAIAPAVHHLVVLRGGMNKKELVSRFMSPLFRNRLGYRLALVENIHHDVACRLVTEVLLSVDGAARNVVAVADLEHNWGLSLDGEGDFARLDRGPLIAGVAMELVAGAGRHGDGYHLYFARRVFLQGRREISDGLAGRRRRLRPCGGCEHAGYCEHFCNDRFFHQLFP